MSQAPTRPSQTSESHSQGQRQSQGQQSFQSQGQQSQHSQSQVQQSQQGQNGQAPCQPQPQGQPQGQPPAPPQGQPAAAPMDARCVKCEGKIQYPDKMLTYNGDTYHSRCFLCVKCHKELAGQSFFNVPVGRVCKPCYMNTMAKTCFKCGEKIVGKMVTTGDGRSYHTDCFRCSACGKVISGLYRVNEDQSIQCYPKCDDQGETLAAPAGQPEPAPGYAPLKLPDTHDPVYTQAINAGGPEPPSQGQSPGQCQPQGQPQGQVQGRGSLPGSAKGGQDPVGQTVTNPDGSTTTTYQDPNNPNKIISKTVSVDPNNPNKTITRTVTTTKN